MLGERFQQILARAREGDSQAFADLWRATNPMLLRYLRVTAGVLAEDVASHAWLRVIEALASFQGDEPGFRRWLVTIARNHYLDEVRRAGRRPERLVPDVIELVELVDDRRQFARDAASIAEENLSTDAALRLVASLPPEQAEMVMLRVVVGLDVADVAQIVGKRPGAVRVAVHRSLRRLADRIEDERGGVTQDPVLAFPHRDA